MLKSIKWIAPILILALVSVADAKADKGKKKDKAGGDVNGTLLSVSRGDLQVRLGGGGEKKGAGNKGAGNNGAANVKPTVVHTDNNTKVTVDGNPGSLKDLHPGMQVSITTNNGLATSVDAKAAKGGKGNKKKNK